MKFLRDWFYAGAALTLLAGLFLMWLWQPRRQIELHSRNLLRAISHRDWTRTAEFVAVDYRDQWQNDRDRLVERAREVFTALGDVELTSSAAPEIEASGNPAHWRSRIMISGRRSEMLFIVQERLNAVQTPFDLEWSHPSAKPWDWKLVHVSNPDLTLPDYVE
jgi:hypothetical protein